MKQLSSIKRAVKRAPHQIGRQAVKAGSNATSLASEARLQFTHLFVRRQNVQAEHNIDKAFEDVKSATTPSSEVRVEWDVNQAAAGVKTMTNPLYERATTVITNRLYLPSSARLNRPTADSPVMLDEGDKDGLEHITMKSAMRAAEKVSVSAQPLGTEAVTGSVEGYLIKLPVYQRPKQPSGTQAVTTGFDQLPMYRRPVLQTAPQQLASEAVTLQDSPAVESTQ